MIVTFSALMLNIVAVLAAEGKAANEVTAEPATNDTCAPLRACGFEPRPRHALLVALGTLLEHLRCPFAINTRYSLVLLEFFCA